MSLSAPVDVVLGHHWLIELHGCSRSRLDDVSALEQDCLAAALAAGATVVEARFHRFDPHGVSGVVMLAESHLTLHTWPEHRYAAADLFSCSPRIDPAPASALLAARLAAADTLVSARLRRGALGPLPAVDLRADRSSLAWSDRFTPGSLLHLHLSLALPPGAPDPLPALLALLAGDGLTPDGPAAVAGAHAVVTLSAGSVSVHRAGERLLVDLHLGVFREPAALAAAAARALGAEVYTLRAEVDGAG